MSEQIENIIPKCVQGDRESQKLLFKTYNKKLYAVALKYMGNVSDAEEVLQDSWMGIFKSLRTYKNEGKLEGWLKTIVVRTAWKAKRKRTFHTDLDCVSNLTTVAESSQAIDKMTCDEVLSLLSFVPASSQQVFKMYVLDEYNHTEISEMLGIDKSTSRAHLAKARKVLREKFEIINNVKQNGLKAI